jgi:putative transcriptional regulator
MESIRRIKPRINRAKIAATTEADIRRHTREDDQNENDLTGFAPAIPPRVLRKQLHMTQTEFARALRIPLATSRNWEQGRVLPDPAARSLLAIVAKKSAGSAQGTCRMTTPAMREIIDARAAGDDLSRRRK